MNNLNEQIAEEHRKGFILAVGMSVLILAAFSGGIIMITGGLV
jgi:hypothetical protein